jgi:predicted nuclease of restriction endonuclease-like RecB superfamily
LTFFQPYVRQLPPLRTEIFKKYEGIKEKIKLRSKFEKTVLFNYIERNPAVKKWNYESFRISYYDSTKDKNRTYVPDFYIEFQDGKKILLEVKPYSHIFPEPLVEDKIQKLNEKQLFYYNRLLNSAETNLIKFKAATEWSEKNGMEFCVFTEVGIFNYKNKDN